MTPARYLVTRDVAADEPRNSTREDVPAGTLLFGCTRPMYGSINEDVEVGLTRDSSGDYPFFGFPLDAVIGDTA